MLDGDRAASTAAQDIAGEGGCHSVGGRLMNGPCDTGIALLGAVSDTFPGQKRLSSSSLWVTPSRSDMSEASSGAAWDGSLLTAGPVKSPLSLSCAG